MSLDDLLHRAKGTVAAAKAEDRQAPAPRRRTKGKRRPVTRITEWAEYPHEFVPLAALSLRWGEQEQTLRKWARTGVLRAFRFGHAWKVKKADAVAFEERAEVKVAV